MFWTGTAQRVTCPVGVKGRGAALNQFFLRLHGLWLGIIHLPRPPPPPFDIETMEPIEPPWQAIKEWIPDDEPNLNWFNQERPPCDSEPDQFDQSPDWKPEEIPLGDGRTLVLEDS